MEQLSQQIGQWLVLVVLPGLGSILMVAGIALAKKYIRRIDNQEVREALRELVMAAEQLYGPGNGEAKRRFVIQKARERGVPADREKVEAVVNEEFPTFIVAPDAGGE
jgi:hypothetical protein